MSLKSDKLETLLSVLNFEVKCCCCFFVFFKKKVLLESVIVLCFVVRYVMSIPVL